MKRRSGVLLLAAGLGLPALVAQEPGWTIGPGTMRLAGAANLAVPAGYSYREQPVDVAELERKAKAKPGAATAVLGAVQKEDLGTLQFTYLYDPGAGTDQLLWRMSAFLGLDTWASRIVRILHRSGLTSAKVLENDRYDRDSASLHCLVGVNLTPKLVLRKRSLIIFLRHGAILAEFNGPDTGFARVDGEWNKLLGGLSISAEETPGLMARVSAPSAAEFEGSWPYAVTGLLMGAGLAIYAHRRHLARRVLAIRAASMGQAA